MKTVINALSGLVIGFGVALFASAVLGIEDNWGFIIPAAAVGALTGAIYGFWQEMKGGSA